MVRNLRCPVTVSCRFTASAVRLIVGEVGGQRLAQRLAAPVRGRQLDDEAALGGGQRRARREQQHEDSEATTELHGSVKPLSRPSHIRRCAA
jgi:hypothetical protein